MDLEWELLDFSVLIHGTKRPLFLRKGVLQPSRGLDHTTTVEPIAKCLCSWQR